MGRKNKKNQRGRNRNRRSYGVVSSNQATNPEIKLEEPGSEGAVNEEINVAGEGIAISTESAEVFKEGLVSLDDLSKKDCVVILNPKVIIENVIDVPSSENVISQKNDNSPVNEYPASPETITDDCLISSKTITHESSTLFEATVEELSTPQITVEDYHVLPNTEDCTASSAIVKEDCPVSSRAFVEDCLVISETVPEVNPAALEAIDQDQSESFEVNNQNYLASSKTIAQNFTATPKTVTQVIPAPHERDNKILPASPKIKECLLSFKRNSEIVAKDCLALSESNTEDCITPPESFVELSLASPGALNQDPSVSYQVVSQNCASLSEAFSNDYYISSLETVTKPGPLSPKAIQKEHPTSTKSLTQNHRAPIDAITEDCIASSEAFLEDCPLSSEAVTEVDPVSFKTINQALSSPEAVVQDHLASFESVTEDCSLSPGIDNQLFPASLELQNYLAPLKVVSSDSSTSSEAILDCSKFNDVQSSCSELSSLSEDYVPCSDLTDLYNNDPCEQLTFTNDNVSEFTDSNKYVPREGFSVSNDSVSFTELTTPNNEVSCADPTIYNNSVSCSELITANDDAPCAELTVSHDNISSTEPNISKDDAIYSKLVTVHEGVHETPEVCFEGIAGSSSLESSLFAANICPAQAKPICKIISRNVSELEPCSSVQQLPTENVVKHSSASSKCTVRNSSQKIPFVEERFCLSQMKFSPRTVFIDILIMLMLAPIWVISQIIIYFIGKKNYSNSQ